jgi:hypothetical protein
LAHGLFSQDPLERLAAARSVGRRERRRLEKAAEGWPTLSPGSLNAWLVLFTAKPPDWCDPLVLWEERPPTLGVPHEGFFYPDRLGFWAEVRRLATALFDEVAPELSDTDALALSALFHLEASGIDAGWALRRCRPAVVLVLDEASLQRAGLEILDREGFPMPDPYRPGTVYEGFWGRLEDGTVVGKTPQHPAAHRLYRPSSMLRFLRACPRPVAWGTHGA